NAKWCQCACAMKSIWCACTSRLPAAASCRSGFHMCVSLRSTSVTAARREAPSESPRRVASSSPPAPPPTMTMRCGSLTRSRAGAEDPQRVARQLDVEGLARLERGVPVGAQATLADLEQVLEAVADVHRR